MSARIPYNRNTPLGGQIARFAGNIVSARKDGQELNRVLQAYLDDETGISTDAGIAMEDVPLVRNLVNQAAAELGETAIVAVNVGASTGSRQFADAMG